MTGVSYGRRMSFAAVFAILSVAIASTAIQVRSMVGQVILCWFAINAMTLSLAYFMNWPGVFGKTDEGTLRWLNAVLMAPILLLIQVVWQLQNILFRTPLYNEIAPDLFVGRLCGYGSLPKDVSVVVDLTAEFHTPRSLRGQIRTICLPTLDGCSPDWGKCQQVFELIGVKHHGIYACCANGHGRSVTFMAAWLGRQRICDSAMEAVKLIQAARPNAAPNRDQVSFLTQAFRSMKPIGPSTSD